jgi:para-aminobenzoate synthetase component 1
MLRDNNNYSISWGIENEIIFFQDEYNHQEFQKFKSLHSKEYMFGYLGYDVKNTIEPSLYSSNSTNANFPDAYFFIPKNILFVSNGTVTYYGSLSQKEIIKLIESGPIHRSYKNDKVHLSTPISEEKYIENILKIQNEIQIGNIYEMNYCLNFSGSYDNFNSFEAFLRLNTKTEAPFSSYLSFKYGSVLSASPERFLHKKKDILISQPIKGTAKRDKREENDNYLKLQLKNDPKEISENVMIVDLVRNDMSKIALKNSVRVEDLFSVKSFKTVHQLISTVKCQIKEDKDDLDIINSLFPMGSMTGAPKISAMKIIEKNESFRRGVYSGAIGFFSPNKNFDFNVVIRSILNNTLEKKLHIGVGGAITIQSDPKKEFNECLLKLKAMRDTLC